MFVEYQFPSFSNVNAASLLIAYPDIKEEQKPLGWQNRIKIASGAAQGLEYLHEKANPPIIYRDLRTTNILLEQDFNPRLSDYGVAKLAGGGNTSHISPRVMGTYSYCAPEYERSGELSFKSDIYSFGVLVLELITGRRAVDTARPLEERNLVAWVRKHPHSIFLLTSLFCVIVTDYDNMCTCD